MAIKEQLDILRQGTKVWNMWRRQQKRRVIDLSKANLSGASLSKANLDNADLSKANLDNADLSKANLDNAYFNEANLHNATLSGANLSGANLSEANLSGANLSEANLRGTDLSGANLSGAVLIHANLSGADLSRADLSRADLSRADLIHTNLNAAILNNVDLSRAKLSGASLYGAEFNGADLSGADLSGADLSGTKLKEAVLHGAKFYNTNLSGADLSGAKFSSTDLSKANFSNANLSGADLIKTNLNGTSLGGADLSRADLSGASLWGISIITVDSEILIYREINFNGANLSKSDLNGANLSKSDLSEANLSGANLSGVNLSGANLDGANLSEAKVGRTIFGDQDLRTIKGMETVHHDEPSYISISALERSQGQIPEIFLKGAGVSNHFIEYAHSLFSNPIEYYTCFISYSSKDDLFARRLHNDLQQEGIRCWFAPEDMDIGDKIKHQIEDSIRLYDKLLLILSEHSISSNWVAYEVERALRKEPEGTLNVLYPVRVDQAILTCTETWAKEIKDTRHIGNFEEWMDPLKYQKSFNRLLRALKAKKGQEKA